VERGFHRGPRRPREEIRSLAAWAGLGFLLRHLDYEHRLIENRLLRSAIGVARDTEDLRGFPRSLKEFRRRFTNSEQAREDTAASRRGSQTNGCRSETLYLTSDSPSTRASVQEQRSNASSSNLDYAGVARMTGIIRRIQHWRPVIGLRPATRIKEWRAARGGQTSW
jgi:hypothetical protein